MFGLEYLGYRIFKKIFKCKHTWELLASQGKYCRFYQCKKCGEVQVGIEGK